MSKSLWHKGPLPARTFGYGGVVLNEQLDKEHVRGFYFADFQGDKAVVSPGTPQERVAHAHEIGMYNNSLQLSPDELALDKP